jgi:hypothetical protein
MDSYFIQDNNGEVFERIPGRIKMRIGAAPSTHSRLGICRKSDIKGGIVDLELRLESKNPNQRNLLHIVVLMSSPQPDSYWRERCYELFCELRSYLAGTVVSN